MFEDLGAWGLEAQIDLHRCDPELMNSNYEGSRQKVIDFVVELCEKIGMKRYGECVVVDFGQDSRFSGYSMAQLIETSLISGHFVNETNNAYLNVFSCKPFNAQEAAKFAREYFKASRGYALTTTIRK